MFGILFSALNATLAFLLRQVVIKSVLFVALWLLTTELAEVISGYLPASNGIQSLFNLLPDGVVWFLNLCQFQTGITACISAWFTRFFIRRIPVLG
ncbi:TPA: DUF2523 domain-containing protein [Escherichia coli]|nr:DUF2523 domain-containing protein [Escherichia coli]